MSQNQFRFGWIPDLPDHRDFMYAAPTPVVQNIPPSADLTKQCPDVYDQGQLGSCTAMTSPRRTPCAASAAASRSLRSSACPKVSGG